MATNDGVQPERPEQPWWAQASTTDERRTAGPKPAKEGDTVAPTGATQAPSSGLIGMPAEFGRYSVRKQLGGGGMGAVYLVENTELKREEALKVPHFGNGNDPDVRERFLREARLAAQLDHPNLCPVYDVGAIDGVCFLTMRYLKGKLLSDFTGKPQPQRKAVEITAKLAQALETAHARGVIHRDLKPNNVMMCAGVGPVVMDFGLAKQTKTEDHKLTQSGTTMGTPSYMPPEQIKGELDRIGPASDVYSLGVILFELLTGRLPFKAPTVAEVYGMVLHTTAPPPSSLRPELNPALDAICAKALAKTPEGRYPSMKVFAAALIDFLKAAPAAEGAGNLTSTKPAPAAIFQAATVAPSQAPHSTPGLRRGPTHLGQKALSSIQTPADTQEPLPEILFSEPTEKKRRSLGGPMVLAALILLVLGALGGVGGLIYALNQKKDAPIPEVVTQTKPTALHETEKASEPAEHEEPAASVQTQESPGVEPTHSDSTPINPVKVASASPVEPPEKPVFVAPNIAPPVDPPTPRPARVESPTPLKSEPPEKGVMFSEDFSASEIGNQPTGWVGKDMEVQVEGDRHCLEVVGHSGQTAYVTLPKQAVKGDFDLDCQFRLYGRSAGFFGKPANEVNHSFVLILEDGPGSGLTVGVDYAGNVLLANIEGRVKDNAVELPKRAQSFLLNRPNQLRLTRKGDVYSVSINDQEVVGRRIAKKGEFQTVKLGLTGGKSSFINAFPACLYSVKITALEPAAVKNDVPTAKNGVPTRVIALPPFTEDFSKTAAGALPDGWKGGKNLAVQKTGAGAALELENGADGDQTTLPKIELADGFKADVTVVLTDPDTSIKVVFKGDKPKWLAVELAYHGAVTVNGVNDFSGSKAWLDDKPNVLQIERAGKGADYVFKLNDVQVGTVPLATAPGPFTRIDLALVKAVRKKSPTVSSIKIVPLAEAP